MARFCSQTSCTGQAHIGPPQKDSCQLCFSQKALHSFHSRQDQPLIKDSNADNTCLEPVGGLHSPPKDTAEPSKHSEKQALQPVLPDS